jgi:site-specific recombinase XerD
MWNFFGRFPTRHDPAKIYVTDVEDYREIRLAQGTAWNTVRKELGYVGTFYNWLRREKCLDIPQPVVWLGPQVRLKPLAGEHIQTPPRPTPL